MRSYTLEVWGDLACFTRPEMKVERVSYEVMTPSAARAVFEAIFWKPAIRWVVEEVQVLKPIQFTTIRRNEVASKASARSGQLFIEDDRQQRAATLLKDVRYVIRAHMELISEKQGDNTEIKVQEMFARRASKGQCIMQPYLGCREFAAYFQLVEDASAYQPVAVDKDLGYMLHDMDFSEALRPMPRFFKAQMRQGRVRIPHPDSEELVA